MMGQKQWNRLIANRPITLALDANKCHQLHYILSYTKDFQRLVEEFAAKIPTRHCSV